MDIYRARHFSLKSTKELENQIKEYQKAFIPEDVDLGMIHAFTQEMTEEMVCSKMLLNK